MTVSKVFSFCVLMFALIAAASPQQARAADAGSVVYLDDEVSQCVADCLQRNPASSKDLEECREQLSSCKGLNEAWRVSYAKLAKECGDRFVAIDKPGDPTKKKPPVTDKKPVAEDPPPKPAKIIVICEGTATKSADGQGCVCEDGVPARLMDSREITGVKVARCVVTIEQFREFVDETTKRFEGVCKPGLTEDQKFPDVPEGKRAELTSRCGVAGDHLEEITLWFFDLLKGKYPLNAKSWNWLVDKVLKLEDDLAKLTKRVADLEKAVDEICPDIPDQPNASREERCKYWHVVYQEQGGAGPFKGGLEWELGLGLSYAYRAGYGTDTTSVLGVVGLIGWVDSQNGMRLRGLVGYGANEDSKRLTIGSELAYLHAFDADKTANLVLGIQGTVEPNDQGNEANNLGGKLGINIRPAKHFFIEPGIVLGGTKAVPYLDGVRVPSLGSWAFMAVPELTLGGTF